MTDSRALLRRTVRAVATATAAGVLVVSAGGWAMTTRYDRAVERVTVFESIPAEQRPTPQGVRSTAPMNLLLVGIDNREGLTRTERNALHLGNGDYGNQTDTIMIVHVGRDAERVSVVGLPRDSLVTIPSWKDAEGKVHDERRNRINAAFTLGGPSLLVRTVTANTGIPIDHYVGVSLKGFVEMVDAVDGVDVCLDAPIKDNPKYTNLDLPAGKSTIRGEMALSFVRARHVGTDFGRMKRQQQFIASMLKKATSLGMLSDPVKLDSFVTAGLQSVQVDERLTRDEILAMARRMSGLSLDKVQFASIPIADDSYSLDGTDLSALVLWKEEGAKKIFTAFKDDTPLPAGPASTTPKVRPLTTPPSYVSVRVLNGSGIKGRGAEVASGLADEGFELATEPAMSPYAAQVPTVIRFDPKDAEAVRTLAAALPGSVLRPITGYGKAPEVTVGSSFTAVKRVEVVDPATINEPEDISSEKPAVLASSTVCQ